MTSSGLFLSPPPSPLLPSPHTPLSSQLFSHLDSHRHSELSLQSCTTIQNRTAKQPEFTHRVEMSRWQLSYKHVQNYITDPILMTSALPDNRNIHTTDEDIVVCHVNRKSFFFHEVGREKTAFYLHKLRCAKRFQ